MQSERLEGESKADYVKRLFEESLPPNAREEYECIVRKDTPNLRRWTVRRKIKPNAQVGGSAEPAA